jgi:hypothetical protein
MGMCGPRDGSRLTCCVVCVAVVFVVTGGVPGACFAVLGLDAEHARCLGCAGSLRGCFDGAAVGAGERHRAGRYTGWSEVGRRLCGQIGSRELVPCPPPGWGLQPHNCTPPWYCHPLAWGGCYNKRYRGVARLRRAPQVSAAPPSSAAALGFGMIACSAALCCAEGCAHALGDGHQAAGGRSGVNASIGGHD